MAEEVQKKRSPWVYVGLGCLAAVVLSCGTIIIVTVAGVGAAKNWAEDMADPNKRENKARKAAMDQVGGVPDGYYPVISFGVPLLFDMVQFVDAPSLADGGFEKVPDRSFMFMRVMETEQSQEVRDFFSGKTKDTQALRNSQVNVDGKEELARGDFMHKDRKVSFVAMKGKLRTQGQNEPQEDGIVSTMLFDCPDDGKLRIGVWQMKDPGTAELGGTVADATEIAKLLTPLSPCGK